MTHLLVVAHGSRQDESNIEIGELAARLRNSGVVLAYLLSMRQHVMTDIPEQVQQVSVDQPNIKIKIVSYLVASKRIDELLIDQALYAYY